MTYRHPVCWVLIDRAKIPDKEQLRALARQYHARYKPQAEVSLNFSADGTKIMAKVAVHKAEVEAESFPFVDSVYAPEEHGTVLAMVRAPEWEPEDTTQGPF